MRFTETQIFSSADMSQAQLTSIGLQLQQGVNWTIQAIWTGSPVGNFNIQISNDIVAPSSGPDPSLNVVNWTTYTGSTQAAGGQSGDFGWLDQNVGYQWVRLIYSKTSGTGTLSATFCGKGYG